MEKKKVKIYQTKDTKQRTVSQTYRHFVRSCCQNVVSMVMYLSHEKLSHKQVLKALAVESILKSLSRRASTLPPSPSSFYEGAL